MSRPIDKRSPSLIAHFFTGGFRPFFLLGALHAALMIALWVPWFLGFIHVPTALSPVVWHQHELLFGFVPAVIAGFLLTAVPNWTGRKAFTGWPLAFLFALWLAGRLAIAGSETIGLYAAMTVAGAFLPVLAGLILKELVAARNSRNYKVVAVIGVLFAAQLAFFHEFDRYGRIDIADRMGIATIIFLITLIGGRIIPSFTGNWLRQNNPGPIPPGFNRFDLTVMVLSALALVAWPISAAVPVLVPLAGLALLGVGSAQFARQLRWKPERTLAEPLVTILHVAFFFVSLGFLLSGAALLLDDAGLRTAGVHAWTSGAIGTMTLAVMTRATRGHSGQALLSPATTTFGIYLPIVLAAALRIGTALAPEFTMILLPLSGLMWVAAFLGFVAFYSPLVMRRKIA
ncbi:short-chain dehydrogenase [Rhizobium sp. KAs_5_22]|uniref:NnrS family protein n=1 Tax=Ciceribacter selenitireducens TaxID=448181 RepID=UPI0004BAF6A4|nr:NnrS family protein [Ciceribacter selenitireducens]PPJ49063.1 short-chain dehydrogenase [Rhizobium sp. KAs_5_22]